MSAATNVFGSSSGSESPRAESTSASSTSRPIAPRPSAFVCQRCLRLLDMFPLSGEMASIDIDTTAEGTHVRNSLFFFSTSPARRSPRPFSSVLSHCNLSVLFRVFIFLTNFSFCIRRFAQVVGTLRAFQVSSSFEAVYRLLFTFL